MLHCSSMYPILKVIFFQYNSSNSQQMSEYIRMLVTINKLLKGPHMRSMQISCSMLNSGPIQVYYEMLTDLSDSYINKQ